jgi:ABC-type multidrug transport system fused ATPase/permease subunit
VFLIIAVLTFLLYLLQSMLGELLGDEITNNLRTEAFNKFLRMPVSWFDRK